MAEKVGLLGVLDLKDFNSSFRQYTSSIDQMNAKTLGFTQNADGGFLSLGNSVLKTAAIVGTAFVAAAGAATVAVGAFVASGISGAIEMEAQLDTVSAILGATTEEAERLKGAVLDLGVDPNLKVTSAEAATAMELLARNGLSVNEILGETGDIMDSAVYATVLLANATGTDFGNAADIATDAMAVFNKTTAEMGDTVSSIVAVTTKSKFTIDDYSLALRNGGAAAFDMGVSLEEFNTVIAASAEELGTGMKAGTGFRNFLFRLTPNTQVAADAMRELGLVTADGSNIFFDANGELKDMADITRILNQALFEEKEILYEVGGRTAQQNEELNRLRDAYNNAAQNVRDYELGIKGATLTDEARNKRIEEQNAIMINAANGMAELESIQGELATSTVRLTTEQRSMALETIFGADALGTVLALAKEGAPAFTSVEEAMAATGLSFEEATKLVEGGTTAFELLYSEMEDVSALEIAETRMDNVAGAMEILQGIIEGVKLQVGDAFLPVIRLLVESLQDLAKNVGPKVISFFGEIAGFIETVVGNLQSGLSPLDAFVQSLEDVGKGDLANRVIAIKDAIVDFIVPIVDFVSLHKDAFIGAIQGIGAALAAATIASLIAGIVTAIIGLFNPITLLIGAVALIGAAWGANWFGIRDTMTEVWGVVQPILQMLGERIVLLGQDLQPVIESLAAFGETLIAAFQDGGISGVLDTLTTSFYSFLESNQQFAVVWEAIQAVISSIVAVVQPAIQQFIENLTASFSSFAPVMDQFKLTWEALKPILEIVGQLFGVLLVTNIGILVGVISGVASAIGAFMNGLAGTIQGILIVIEGFATTISGIFDLIVGLVTGNNDLIQQSFQKLNEGVGEIFRGLALAIVNIIFGLGTTLAEFLSGFVEGIVGFFQSLYDQLVGHSIIPDMVEGILEWFTTLVDNTLSWIGEWVISLISKFIDLYTDIRELINTMWVQIKDTFQQKIIEILSLVVGFVTDIASNFTSFDWLSIGSSVVQGIANGISGGIGAIAEAARGVAQTALDAAKGLLGIDSPSKEFMLIGQFVTQGFNDGIEKGRGETIKAVQEMADAIIAGFQERIGSEGFNIFDFGAGIGSFGSAIVKRFEDQTLNPLKKRSAQIEDVVANLQKRIGGELGVEFSSLKIDEIIRLSKGEGEFKRVSQRAILGAKSLLNVYEQQETVNRQIREEQEKIAALQKAQADLAFLKQQMDFLDFLREQGLDAAEILNGVTLGLNADLPALLEAMTAAMQAVVQAAEDELQIASPSKIFEKIGQFTIGGFVSGVQDMAQTAQNSMRDFTRGVVSSVTGNMGSSNISNNNSRNLAVNLNNNFTGNPQITDKSQLEMALASFV